MSYRHLLTLLGIILIVLGLAERGWFLVAVWLGCDFLVLGIAHGRGSHRVFGKRADGTLPLWSWVAFLPLLIYTTVVWHLIRLFSREPARNAITEQLVVVLDGGAPTPAALRAAVASLRPGRTFIHCAQGHGRTGLFALAVLLSSGAARSVEDGLRMLSEARPAIRLSREQLRCIEMYAQNMG